MKKFINIFKKASEITKKFRSIVRGGKHNNHHENHHDNHHENHDELDEHNDPSNWSYN